MFYKIISPIQINTTETKLYQLSNDTKHKFSYFPISEIKVKSYT